MCHPNYGPRVYIVYDEYILLKSRDVDLEHFLTDILSSKNDNLYNRVDINDEKFIEDLLKAMDTALDKKVAKVILGAMQTRLELVIIGMGNILRRY